VIVDPGKKKGEKIEIENKNTTGLQKKRFKTMDTTRGQKEAKGVHPAA
jgi:hypothetical protein